MRIPSSALRPRAALLCAALALGTGCESMKPRATPPDDGTSVTQQAEPAPTPDASVPEAEAPPPPTGNTAGNTPWRRARVGDRVAYDFSAHRGVPSGGRGAGVAGRMTLEVVAVEPPWAWLTVSFTDDGGRPLAQPRLARDLTLPMRLEETHPLDTSRQGIASAEQPAAAGRTWDARRYLRDGRPADGPLENRLYAVEPGPLYLTNGLLDASTTLSGFGASGSYQLTLVDFRQGSGTTGTVPALERPLGPGAWYDVRQDVSGTSAVRRVCLGAERGYVLRKETPVPATGGAPCEDFKDAEVKPLEEVLLGFIWESLALPAWPPVPAGTAPVARETFAAGEHKVSTLTFEAPHGEPAERKVQVTQYAAEPWDVSLAGLAHEARFQPLGDTVYRVPAKGKRQAEDGTRLSGWGTWTKDARP